MPSFSTKERRNWPGNRDRGVARNQCCKTLVTGRDLIFTLIVVSPQQQPTSEFFTPMRSLLLAEPIPKYLDQNLTLRCDPSSHGRTLLTMPTCNSACHGRVVPTLPT